MSRVFVTGGSGFFGSAIVRELLGRGHKVAVLQRYESASKRLHGLEGQITRILGLVESSDWLAEAISFEPQVVIHAAWEGVVSRSRNDRQQLKNLLGLQTSLELAAHSGSHKWIGIGSQAEYGSLADSATEETPPRPNSRYGETKVEALNLASFFCEFNHINLAWVRVYSLYGPADSPEFLIPYLIEKLLDGETPDLTLGEQLWDYLYVDDAANAVVGLVESLGDVGVFNLGSGTAIALKTLIEQLRDKIDPALHLGFGNLSYSPQQVFELRADVGKIHSAIGWRPTTTWEEGIEKTIEWHRTQRLKLSQQSNQIQS